MIHEVRFTVEKIASRLKLIEPLVYRKSCLLPSFKYKMFAQGGAHLPADDSHLDAEWQTLAPYQYWGAWNKEFVLLNQFALPEDFVGEGNPALYLPLGEAGDFSHPEALAYADGAPFAACDRNHQELELPALWQDGRPHLLMLHGWTGLGGGVFSEPTQLFMRPCKLVQIDLPARAFIAKVRVALGVARNLDENDPARARILNALEAAFHRLDTREPLQGEIFYASLPAAQAALDKGLDAAGEPQKVDLFATGHAHIDVAWLWPLAVTRQKARRTFTNAVRLLEHYPAFHFSQSQPQLYEFVRQDDPELFKHIQQQAAAGRWEVLGGMWLEADCNLTGAESLARQFLLGRNYFTKYFGAGAETPVLWLPDAFGFCASLPQLIRLAGLNYFFTIKLSWNQYNRMPYDSFWWQGLDGSRVLAHFSTTPSLGNEWKAATYNAEVEPGQVMGTWRNFQQKELHPNLLMAYGFGDGGGGPTREMIENLELLQHFPAAPKVRSASVREFFETLEREDGAVLPTWNGELYLELHRGTYTSQSRSKRANRKAEFALHDAEFAAAAAAVLNSKYAYPQDELNKDWRLVCLNQFHDILPGSSIHAVYSESQAQCAQVMHSTQQICQAALQAAADALTNERSQPKKTNDLWLVNPTGFKRSDLIFWPEQLEPGSRFRRADGEPVLSQAVKDGTWLAAGDLPPYSFNALSLEPGAAPQFEQGGVKAAPDLLENDSLRVEFNKDGDITRIFDKARQREVLPAGATANQFQAFEDRPVNWDAWDLDKSYDDRIWFSGPADSIRVLENGPLRAALEIHRRILHSPYIQRVSLAYNTARLDFETVIEWNEKHILLKTAFPVEVLADQATYEIQWGNVRRSTHENTSWDWARFETSAHKWVDLSEGGYGVSLLNDCKYGYDIHGNVMRLSLLRSPTEPDARADEGEHRFQVALLPHNGGWDENTAAAAYALNDPCLTFSGPAGVKVNDYSLISVDSPNIVIETVKQAEDGRGLIVRLYEYQRKRGWVTLQTGFPLAQAWVTDLLENPVNEIKCQGKQLSFEVKPFQIITLRLTAKD